MTKDRPEVPQLQLNRAGKKKRRRRRQCCGDTKKWKGESTATSSRDCATENLGSKERAVQAALSVVTPIDTKKRKQTLGSPAMASEKHTKKRRTNRKRKKRIKVCALPGDSLRVSTTVAVTPCTISGATRKKNDSQWQEMYHKLVTFQEEESHCLVPKSHDKSLYSWVKSQRSQYKNGKLLPKEPRFKLLTDLGFTWDAKQAKWNNWIHLLEEFKQKHDHCRVPVHFTTPKGEKLGRWVTNLRSERERVKLWRSDSLSREETTMSTSTATCAGRNWKPVFALTKAKVKQLEDVGFCWLTDDEEQWECMFQKLMDFKVQNGHCNVPQYRKPKPKKQPLDSADVGSVSRDSKSDGELHDANADSIMVDDDASTNKDTPDSHAMFGLGCWVKNQKARATGERKSRLQQLGLSFPNSLDHKWVNDCTDEGLEQIYDVGSTFPKIVPYNYLMDAMDADGPMMEVRLNHDHEELRCELVPVRYGNAPKRYGYCDTDEDDDGDASSIDYPSEDYGDDSDEIDSFPSH
jgi:Helicase associated domain